LHLTRWFCLRALYDRGDRDYKNQKNKFSSVVPMAGIDSVIRYSREPRPDSYRASFSTATVVVFETRYSCLFFDRTVQLLLQSFSSWCLVCARLAASS
jgi:hypothetical protein